MFNFAWSEIALIAVVALIAIGPKDMPVAIRTITDLIKKARRMAGEFQTHVDEMVREANLDEVRDQISQIRNFDVRGEIERAVDPDGSLRTTFAGNPLDTPTATPAIGATDTTVTSEAAVGEHADIVIARPNGVDRAEARAAAPDWLPPSLVKLPEREPEMAEAPAFVPPSAARAHQVRP